MAKFRLFGAKITLKDPPQLQQTDEYIYSNQTIDPSFPNKRNLIPQHQRNFELLKKLSEDKIVRLNMQNLRKNIELKEDEALKWSQLKGFMRKPEPPANSKRGFNMSSLRFKYREVKDVTGPGTYQLAKEFEMNKFNAKGFGSMLSKAERMPDNSINTGPGPADYKDNLNENLKKSLNLSSGRLYKIKNRMINGKNTIKDESPGPGYYDPNLIQRSVNSLHHAFNGPVRELNLTGLNAENPAPNHYNIDKALVLAPSSKKKMKNLVLNSSTGNLPMTRRELISTVLSPNNTKNDNVLVNMVMKLEKFDNAGKIKRFERRNNIFMKNGEFIADNGYIRFKYNPQTSLIHSPIQSPQINIYNSNL